MVSFSCPGGDILGCPFALSSDPLLEAPFTPFAGAELEGIEFDGAGFDGADDGFAGCSFPPEFTAVNREVGDSTAVASSLPDISTSAGLFHFQCRFGGTWLSLGSKGGRSSV